MKITKNKRFLHAVLSGILAYAFMPRYCPRCYGLHHPMFWPYPGAMCHDDEYCDY